MAAAPGPAAGLPGAGTPRAARRRLRARGRPRVRLPVGRAGLGWEQDFHLSVPARTPPLPLPTRSLLLLHLELKRSLFTVDLSADKGEARAAGPGGCQGCQGAPHHHVLPLLEPSPGQRRSLLRSFYSLVTATHFPPGESRRGPGSGLVGGSRALPKLGGWSVLVRHWARNGCLGVNHAVLGLNPGTAQVL